MGRIIDEYKCQSTSLHVAEAGVVESTSSVGVGLLEVGVSSGGLGSATTTTTSLNTLPVASDNAVDFVEIKRQKEVRKQAQCDNLQPGNVHMSTQ